MNTPQVQRLRQLKQLGTSDFTYINTTHTRFEHSLGVMSFAGTYLEAIAKRQPRLNITTKDIVCVKIAGLLHDLGHGPYSHVYDGTFRKQLKLAKEKGEWLGQKFDTKNDCKCPDPMDGWAHEDGSLMMIDAMLKHLGLEIDESNLDEPLKQVGNGINAKQFCIWNREDSNDEVGYMPNELVLTSRDWIFIKECIAGGPLPPLGVSLEKFKDSSSTAKMIGRPDVHKEFLYDIVSNRHSGLDVDKMDYLARDTIRAHGSNCIADLMSKLTEKSFVCWGNMSSDEDEPDDMHMIIAYDSKMVQNLMSFFEQRYKEHQRLYTHPKTQKTNYEICDIFLLAEPYFRIISMNDEDDDDEPADSIIKLSISRAMCNPDTYLELTDTVLDKIINTETIELKPARRLIKKLRSHEKYVKCGDIIITSEIENLWDMTEDEIVAEILKLSDEDMTDNDSTNLSSDDIIVDKGKIHHGMKDKNPVDFMRFLPKQHHMKLLNHPEDLPIAIPIQGDRYRKPDKFIQKSVRVYCRSTSVEKQNQLTKCYKEFTDNLRSQQTQDSQFGLFEVEEEYARPPPSPNTATLPSVSQTPEKYGTPKPDNRNNGGKRRYDDSLSLFSNVKKMSKAVSTNR